jgi:hypothetical protein
MDLKKTAETLFSYDYDEIELGDDGSLINAYYRYA